VLIRVVPLIFNDHAKSIMLPFLGFPFKGTVVGKGDMLGRVMQLNIQNIGKVFIV